MNVVQKNETQSRPIDFREKFGDIFYLHKSILKLDIRIDVVPFARVKDFNGLLSSKFVKFSNETTWFMYIFLGSVRKDLDGNIHMHPEEYFDWCHIFIGNPILSGSYECDLADQAETYLQKYTLRGVLKVQVYFGRS